MGHGGRGAPLNMISMVIFLFILHLNEKLTDENNERRHLQMLIFLQIQTSTSIIIKLPINLQSKYHFYVQGVPININIS